MSLHSSRWMKCTKHSANHQFICAFRKSCCKLKQRETLLTLRLPSTGQYDFTEMEVNTLSVEYCECVCACQSSDMHTLPSFRLFLKMCLQIASTTCNERGALRRDHLSYSFSSFLPSSFLTTLNFVFLNWTKASLSSAASVCVLEDDNEVRERMKRRR